MKLIKCNKFTYSETVPNPTSTLYPRKGQNSVRHLGKVQGCSSHALCGLRGTPSQSTTEGTYTRLYPEKLPFCLKKMSSLLKNSNTVKTTGAAQRLLDKDPADVNLSCSLPLSSCAPSDKPFRLLEPLFQYPDNEDDTYLTRPF